MPSRFSFGESQRWQAIRHGIAVAALATVLGLAPPARADFAEGVKAYEAGDYKAAYESWLPLAERGDVAAMRNLGRSEEHTSELQALMRTAYAVFCLTQK